MDIARPDIARRKRHKLIIVAVLGVIVVALITMGLSRLRPAAPTVERSTVWIDTVKRGTMLRQVRGLGTLVPEDIHWIAASSEGRVSHIHILPGTAVAPDTVLVELVNPQLQQAALDAEWKLKAAEADYKNIQAQLESQVLSEKATAAQASADANQARLQADTDRELAKLGVISELSLKASTGKAEQLGTVSEIQRQRVANSGKVLEAQLVAKRAEIEQFRALAKLNEDRLAALKVQAGTKGVLQELPLTEGQWVTPGTTLAKVVQPEKLKAQLKIAETQAKDIQLGQPASIDTHNGVIAGRVIRIDPSVQEGTVTVDVKLEDALPQGARPDLSVDGTVDLERLTNILYVGRPALGEEKSTVGMFKLEADGKTAIRVPVKLGRSSVNTVEAVEGLHEGDQVILSDMSRWDSFERVQLE